MEINLLDTFGHKHLAMRGEKEIHMKNAKGFDSNIIVKTLKVATCRIFGAASGLIAKVLATVGLEKYASQVTVFLLAVIALQFVQSTSIGVAATKFLGAVIAKAISLGIAVALGALVIKFVKGCLNEVKAQGSDDESRTA